MLTHQDIQAPLREALARRAPLLEALAAEGTDCLRLLHGATEGVPKLAIDRYGPILLVQTWREPLAPEAIERLGEQVREALGVDLVPCWNHRPADDWERHHAPALPADPEGRELGLRYDVRPRHRGHDPLLFLDFRATRRWVKAHAAGRSVLNLFAYTCGVGVAAAAGGAREVRNVDFAASALEVGRANAARNGVSMETLREDVIPVLRQLAGLPVKGRGARRKRFTKIDPRPFDLVVLDPPRWAKSAFGAVDVVRDSPSLFKPAVLATAPGGQVLATNHVPHVALEDWLDVLRRCAMKAGRPLGEVEVLPPEADFPSPDGRPPLKVALCEVP